MDITEYCNKYGYRGLSCLVERFIEASPQFEGDIELAEVIGTVIGDLEEAIRSYQYTMKAG